MTGLTPHQQRALDAFRAFVGEHGYSPTAAELGRVLGVHGSTARVRLVALADKGHLRWEHGRTRGFSLW